MRCKFGHVTPGNETVVVNRVDARDESPRGGFQVLEDRIDQLAKQELAGSNPNPKPTLESSFKSEPPEVNPPTHKTAWNRS